ncbi:DHH family phosphoesterase [Lachnotalea glycerini]|uniref:Bifunctional oligoribonuclease/PAP phosphatase NrnA n=1 Tax=Lachnotalea glycerini TaxID=1763509 RepID=A0A371JII0_9FIRM|nr:bifunctional oligoribonuclease/PAP phosphatase NrnA [Lachnotalea glycerini]RDY32551.1 bifunctional oligoribonuclease/PAP phosphatase NrnA [Lachnotalea glycerini]
MNKLADQLEGIKTVAIAGHVRPDGDCTGSCLGLYNYIKDCFADIEADVYLEEISEVFHFIKNTQVIDSQFKKEQVYDLFIALDSGDKERLGEAVRYFDTAKKTICIDHHISNTGFADVNHILPNASSTCEIVYTLLEEAKISKAVAEALYTGIVHDTGVFQYSNTSELTMNIAGKLISKGINFTKIIEETFYKKTFVQNQILGKALLESKLLLDGKVIVSALKKVDMERYASKSNDLEGIVSQLRITEGVECAIFLYEMDNHEYKVSLRSTDYVDVSKIAGYFGGGGHKKAAGCTMAGTIQDIVKNLSLHIKEQLCN